MHFIVLSAEKSLEEQEQERKQVTSRSRERNDIPPCDLRESYILEDNEEGIFIDFDDVSFAMLFSNCCNRNLFL